MRGVGREGRQMGGNNGQEGDTEGREGGRGGRGVGQTQWREGGEGGEGRKEGRYYTVLITIHSTFNTASVHDSPVVGCLSRQRLH